MNLCNGMNAHNEKMKLTSCTLFALFTLLSLFTLPASFFNAVLY